MPNSVSEKVFCVYNDVAFTALYLIEKYKLERVLVLDTECSCRERDG